MKKIARTRVYGFTLLEAMITVALIGVLAAIAYPSYRNAVLRTHRTDARAELSRTAQQLEKCFTRHATYNSAMCAVATPYALSGKVTVADGRYEISGVIDAAAFTMTATAKGVQSADTACATMTLTDTNIRSPAGCW